MSSSLGFSEISNGENIKDIYKPKNNHKKTIKNREKKKVTSENMESFLNLMSNVGNDDSNDGTGLADFKPQPKPVLTKQPDEIEENSVDSSLSSNDFNKLNDNQINKEYYNKYIPYYSESQNNANLSGNKDHLFEKLNYMIHLLEENKDQKTQNVTEELILYMFLGVFVIFVVDSFARSGKYVR